MELYEEVDGRLEFETQEMLEKKRGQYNELMNHEMALKVLLRLQPAKKEDGSGSVNIPQIFRPSSDFDLVARIPDQVRLC